MAAPFEQNAANPFPSKSILSFVGDRKNTLALDEVFYDDNCEATMKFNVICLIGCALMMSALTSTLSAAYTLKKGRLVSVEEVARYSAQEHFAMGCEALNASDWKESAKQFHIVITNFPTTSYGQEAHYYLGVCHYHLKEYDFANESFTAYLKAQSNPRFFQETVEYKYAIAERFTEGAKRRFFGTKKLPKWACGKSMALQIYDEVVAAVPSHDIAARALVSKGCLLWQWRDYRPAVEAFQMVIRRFPKHELAPECYIYISRVFLAQCMIEFQNPDILAFAEINLRKFRHEFPREERIAEAECNVQAIKEVYAKGLYETGQFYERTCKKFAAIIYYRNAIHQFPETCIASLCRDRLCCLDPTFQEDPDEITAEEADANLLEMTGVVGSDNDVVPDNAGFQDNHLSDESVPAEESSIPQNL